MWISGAFFLAFLVTVLVGPTALIAARRRLRLSWRVAAILALVMWAGTNGIVFGYAIQPDEWRLTYVGFATVFATLSGVSGAIAALIGRLRETGNL